ncbi:MAG: Fe-S cluster assembly protein SufD [Actinomycetota bacterium]|nr:Fe-S cluster assembly protein SufD [Actinomycetota bacterium]
MPTDAEEIWRYSRVADLDLDAFAPDTDAGTVGGAVVPDALAPAVAAAGPRAALVIVRNGRISHIEIDPALAAKGLVVTDGATLPPGSVPERNAGSVPERNAGSVPERNAGSVPERNAGDDVPGQIGVTSIDAFGELNLAFGPGAVVVRVPAGLEVGLPVLVFHWLDGERVAAFPRTIVETGSDSSVTVVEHQGSADVAAFVDPVVELRAGDASRLSYVNVQDLGPRVWQIGYQVSSVGRDATLRSSMVALGGCYARVRTDSRIEGKGGTGFLTAAYFADGDRMHDFRTLQDHAAPSSTSELLFKGAVQDRGRSVYSGLIRVRKEARGTNAFQTNRNLVLSEGASAESVPNLEIETDDVRCSHASAVGPIEDEQRYYLESRGVPPDVAERLIVLGFLGEVIDELPTPSFVAGLRSAVARRLAVRDS